MGERRKRKSLWDQGDETKHFSGVSEHNSWSGNDHHSHHEFSASRTFAEPKSRDHPGQPSWKSTEEISVASMQGSFINSRQDAPERKEMGRGNTDYEDMSPGFDGIEQHKYDQDLGNGRSHSRRGRSRSRSRSRTRGKSCSRSRERGRGRARGRSRSRSGSRSDGNARGKNRSRSPVGDYRRQSYGWSDKRGAPDKSSQISLQGDTSDPYHGQSEQFRNRSRNEVPCKDFIKGKCRWGDTCRFSHQIGYPGTFEKSTGYTTFNKDVELHPHKNGKEICKYFAAGKCDRHNCRFSHEDRKYSSLEGRQSEVAKAYGSHDKISKWSDAARISDNVKPVGHNLGNDNRNWGVSEWSDNPIKLVKPPSPPGVIGGYVRDIGTAESIGKENLANKQGHHVLHGSRLQNQEANARVQGPNTVQEDLSMQQQQQPDFSSAIPNQQQYPGTVESNLVTSLSSNVLGEVGNSINITQSSLISEQSFNQNVENVFLGFSPMLNETGTGQNQLYPNLANGLRGKLNGPETHQMAPLNLEPQVQKHLKTVQMAGILERKIPQFVSDLLTNELSSQATNPTVAVTDQHTAPVTVPSIFPNQRFMNEQTQKIADAEGSNSQGIAPFSNSLGNAAIVSAANLQFNQARVAHESIGPEQSCRGVNEHQSHTEEQCNEMKVGQSSTLSTVDKELNSTNMDHPRSPPKQKQESLPTNLEVDQSNPVIGNESKGAPNNMESETMDRHGKVEEKSATKDDKTIRTFKNSLIEFVKDLLKPTWKEGKMSREAHKTVVKKVVEKVTSTIQADHIPKTQDKVDQYLSYSKPKIAKLVQAYVARCSKADPKS